MSTASGIDSAILSPSGSVATERSAAVQGAASHHVRALGKEVRKSERSERAWAFEALASFLPTPVATAQRSPMSSVGIDDREVHVMLLANLAWHRRWHGSEHSFTAIVDTNM